MPCPRVRGIDRARALHTSALTCPAYPAFALLVAGRHMEAGRTSRLACSRPPGQMYNTSGRSC